MGGARDVLKVTDYGELIETDNVELLADRLEDLIENWSEYEHDPQVKMDLMEEKFGWPKLCKKLYKKLKE